ncbi:MAG: Eco57I restriction-modification methylase domain-containing protein [Deltaproteobacteria bacterium]|nr:Eco57I restriction-modification methylase domain-containing protein [Deltaproteobacteria bacterium]
MMLDMVRLEASAKLNRQRKVEFGQFLTPSSVARFMAGLFPASSLETARLLDAGAGIGSLSAAFLDRWASGGFSFKRVETTAYEIEDSLRRHLSCTLERYAARENIGLHILGTDFIEDAITQIQFHPRQRFTHAILNPPYKKIGSHSRHRLLLRHVGVETVNLYSAFVALAVLLMEPHGQIVAIIPRSFCNGPYYRPFREFLFKRVALRHMHLFGARDKAFKDDAVLQENIILLMECGGKQGDVTISTSTDDSFSDYAEHHHHFDRIVVPGDTERFIHVPTSPERNAIDLSKAFAYSLADLGIEVSTGPVVDFRMKEHLRDMPAPGTIPLLYPCHFAGQSIEWPKQGAKKPNAIMLNTDTEKWLFPNGFYAVVRRFSSKEERRRIVASMVTPSSFDAQYLGFENHLNVFHHAKKGLSEELVRGLVVYLNSTVIDEYFRRFSGHTQVNATDLRLMKYPSRNILISLGRWASRQGELRQEEIDRKIGSII